MKERSRTQADQKTQRGTSAIGGCPPAVFASLDLHGSTEDASGNPLASILRYSVSCIFLALLAVFTALVSCVAHRLQPATGSSALICLFIEPYIQPFRAVILSRTPEKTLTKSRLRSFHPSHNRVSRSELPAAGSFQSMSNPTVVTARPQRAIYLQIAGAQNGALALVPRCELLFGSPYGQSISLLCVHRYHSSRAPARHPLRSLYGPRTPRHGSLSRGCFPCRLLFPSAHPYNSTRLRM